jgi:hypothetical protein
MPKSTSDIKPIVIEGEKLQDLHDLLKLTKMFVDHHKSIGCMARDKSKCAVIAEGMLVVGERLVET